MPLVAAAAAAVVGILVAVAMPGDTRLSATGRVPGDAPRARLAGTSGASWTGVVTLQHAWLLGVIGVVVGAIVGVATRNVWFALMVAAIFAVVVVAAGRWTVTIDDRGVVARTPIPAFRVAIPLDEVEFADVTRVDPLREFGGWGYRIGMRGRSGIVMRAGEALVVHRSGGRQLLVTVDNAERGAALLNALVERTRR